MAWRQLAPGIYEGVPGELSDEIDRRIRLSNIPTETLTTHQLRTWEHRGDEPWWPEVEAYAQRQYQHPFLTLLGPRGTGKTHIAFGVGWEWLRQGAGVLYYHVEDLLDALRRGYALSEKGAIDSYDLTLEFTRQANLLILDDLGAHNETDWAVVKLDQIIDYRYERRKPLIATTNLALNRLPERIADRLNEGLLIHLTGESYRKKKKHKE
jgi:DNA replication protein DnaC